MDVLKLFSLTTRSLFFWTVITERTESMSIPTSRHKPLSTETERRAPKPSTGVRIYYRHYRSPHRLEEPSGVAWRMAGKW